MANQLKSFNQSCECSDQYEISVRRDAICKLCRRGFCSTECEWIEGHTDENGKPCPGRWKVVFVGSRKKT